jgi:hypothetical protein
MTVATSSGVRTATDQVCSYDREGLGRSVADKGAEPETECADEQLDDLKNLLKVAHVEQVWRFQAIDPRSVQGPPADPERVKRGGGLPYPGERLVWHTDKPLIVLEHGIPLTFEGPMTAHTSELNAAVDSMAKDLASRSTKSQLRIAKNSGHDIMLDEPQIVVQAIRDVWQEALNYKPE